MLSGEGYIVFCKMLVPRTLRDGDQVLTLVSFQKDGLVLVQN